MNEEIKMYRDEDPPEEFVDQIADLMRKHGPDGHIDGCEIIAKFAWNHVRKEHGIGWETYEEESE